jgi:predicted phage terminase large subunit-like protein
MEPKPFVPGYHVDAICEHLQAVSDGDLANLLMNVPPRHTKSTLTSVAWPAWDWSRHPWLRWLFASYGADLAIRDSVRCRRLIESAWYQERYGRVYQLEADQNQKTRYETTRGGRRLATSVGGAGTGEGGDRIVVDDPLKADEASSDPRLDEAINWWDGTISTRGDDPATVSKVIIMQRLHERDLTGHVLELMQQDGEPFDHLVLPAEYEPTVQVCLAGLPHDWREAPGEPLWPERWPTERLAVLKTTLGEMGTAGQLQQRPSPAGGSVFKREWWETDETRYHVEQPALVTARWLSLDTAFKDGEENDPTACLVFEALADGRFRVREVWSERLTFPRLLPQIVSTAVKWNMDGNLQAVAIEDKASGQSAVQVLRSSSPPWLSRLILPIPARHSKLYRARAASLWCAEKLVLLPHPSAEVPWLWAFEEELYKFPTAAHDDQVDTLSQIIIELDAYFRRSQRARQPGQARGAA